MKRNAFFKKLTLLRGKVFYQYVLSYLLVFLLPFSVVSWIWYHTSISSINEQMELSVTNYLLQAKSIINSQLLQLDLAAKQMTTDSKLSEYMLNDPYYTVEAQQELQRYKLNQRLVQEVYVYHYSHPDTLYSSNGKLAITTLLNMPFKEYQLDEGMLRSQLLTKKSLLLPLDGGKTEDSGEMIAYIVPLTNEAGTIYGSILYSIKVAHIKGILEKAITDQKGNLFILNKEQQLLASMNSANQWVQSIDLSKITKQKNIKIRKKEYLVNVTQDTDFGLTFVAITNPSEPLLAVQTIHTRFIGIFILIFIIGIGLVFLIGRKRYLPIKKLEKLLEKQKQPGASNHFSDDFERLNQQVKFFLEENQELHQEIRRQTPQAREQVIRKLLTGYFKETEELMVLLHSVEVKISSVEYFVIILDTKLLTKEASIQNQSFLMNFLDTLIGDGFKAYGTELLSKQAIALLVGVAEKQDQQAVVSKIIHQIKKENAVVPPMGVGNLVNDLSMINHSYIEGLTALESGRMYKNDTSPYFYQQLAPQLSTSINYPVSEQLKLIQSLTQGDSEIAKETIQQMIAQGITEITSLAGSKLYGFYLLNTLAKVGNEILGERGVKEIERLVDFRGLFELEAPLVALATDICLAVKQQPNNSESQLRKDIVAYIDQHYTDNQLTLEEVASQFDLSLSYLSRFIKKECGMTFSKYIQQLRLEKIKEALIETELPIKDIIQAYGYYDVSNFTRKFKQAVGVTPGQYRQLNR